MISFKKSKSHVVAAIGTLLIHALLLGFLSIDYFGQDSSSLSNEELDNLELHLEDLDAEDIPLPPPGKDPLSGQKDKSSESLSGKKGLSKLKASASPMRSQADREAQELMIPDTLPTPKKKDLLILTKPDSVLEAQKDSVVQAEITKAEKILRKVNSNEERKKALERFEFYKKNLRNIRNFKIVYPYALKTKEIMENLNNQLSQMTDESEKKKLIKETEKMLFKEYEAAVRTMSTSQGRLLLKLISRETALTGYDIIKEYKGTIPASFWYGVGKLFGTDLKTEFHREKEDSLIETIVKKYKDNDLY